MDSKTLARLARRLTLLTVNNSKLRLGEQHNYLTAGLHLAPAWLSGYNACAFHTFECATTCLYFSGMGRFPQVSAARLRKTRFFFENRSKFLEELHADIWLATQVAYHLKMVPAMRLNLTSDILWERYNIPQSWPTVQFYDYTKVPARRGVPPNYHLTFLLVGITLMRANWPSIMGLMWQCRLSIGQNVG